MWLTQGEPVLCPTWNKKLTHSCVKCWQQGVCKTSFCFQMSEPYITRIRAVFSLWLWSKPKKSDRYMLILINPSFLSSTSDSKDENGKYLYSLLDIWNVQTHTYSRTEQNVIESNRSNKVKNQNSEQFWNKITQLEHFHSNNRIIWLYATSNI